MWVYGFGKVLYSVFIYFYTAGQVFFWGGIMIVYFFDGIEKNEPRVLWFYVVFYTF